MVSFIKGVGNQFVIQYNYVLFCVRILIFYLVLSLGILYFFPYKFIFFFNYIFYLDSFTIFVLMFLLLKFIVFLFLIENSYSTFKGFLADKNIFISFEIVLLFLFSVLGMVGIICSNDFIILYLSIELQSLALYVLASSTKNEQSAVEGGIKYFILGAFATSIFLFGFSILYGFLGLYSFDSIILFLNSNSGLMNGSFNFFILGSIMIFSGLLFKLAIFPFHQWLPDIYESCNFLIVIFFAVISKLSIIYLFIKLLLIVFVDQYFLLNFLLVFCSFFSIILGSIGALFQVNIKRLLAYSSISNMGYLLLILMVNNTLSATVGILFYINYILSITFILTIFYFLKMSSHSYKDTDKFFIFLSYFKKDYIISMLLIMFLFTLFGMPPFLGFFTKFYLLILVVSQKYYLFLLVIFFVTILSVFYYFRLINYFFFNLNKFNRIGFVSLSESMAYLIVFSSLVIIGFIFYPNSLLGVVSGVSMDFYI